MNNTIKTTALQAVIKRAHSQPQNETKLSLFIPHTELDNKMKITNHQNYFRS